MLSQKTHFICSKHIWAASWQNQQCGCAPSEDSDQIGHPPSLIRVFAVCSMGSYGSKLSSCGQRRLWSDWAAQADLSLRWVHTHSVGFVGSFPINCHLCTIKSIKLLKVQILSIFHVIIYHTIKIVCWMLCFYCFVRNCRMCDFNSCKFVDLYTE